MLTTLLQLFNFLLEVSGVPTKLLNSQTESVEKGESMEYEAPEVEVVGPASYLIQNFIGPRYDGDGYALSEGAVASAIEEE